MPGAGDEVAWPRQNLNGSEAFATDVRRKQSLACFGR
jgi:hypothetical protein